MAELCGCCSAFKPRYKRLVDSIFPADPQEGLVKSNMDKLTFFAMKSPEKLDRIGDYLAQRLSRDVSRQRNGYVRIAMEAMDNLLVTCHAPTLNLFVESFLKMVQKLLECNEPQLQVLATSSFVMFSNKEEDTPSYHRRYDFFVSKFSAMCHNNHQDMEDQIKTRLRVAGLQGLQGVVRKTVLDDLQVNIWDKTHMDKIVPSLLFNLEGSMERAAESPREEERPCDVAETVFRDLVCRASYGTINAIIRPVLMHLDNHQLWVPNHFAVHCFKIIMYSVQAQYGYVVVEMLMEHLDQNIKQDAQIKASIVNVLAETVLIAAGGSIGPTVLEVFNTLLRHLRLSLDSDTSDPQKKSDEKNFQEAVINTIGEFANHLPDYQKIQILMFVMGKVPKVTDADPSSNNKEVLLQTMLMKTILKVATKYKTVEMSSAFPSSFLEPLLKMSMVPDSGTRKIVQEILQTLLDRHDNAAKLKTVRIPKDIVQLDLTMEEAPRQDFMFMKKNGSLFYWHLYENMQQSNNKVDNYEALYCTMVLLLLEMGGGEVRMELLRLALGIQKMAIKNSLPVTHQSAILALVSAYMNLISQLYDIPLFCEHVDSVIAARTKKASHLLPDIAFNRHNTSRSYPKNMAVTDDLLFDVDVITSALEARGHDTSRLSVPFVTRPSGLDAKSKPYTVDMNISMSDIHSTITDFESATTTPILVRRGFSAEEITFDSMKKILEVNPKQREEDEENRRRIIDSFRNGPFEEIVAKNEQRAQQIQDKVDEILAMIAQPQHSPGGSPRKPIIEEESVPIYEIQFPELFVY
ncbi:hypothetical protein CAPTEDRAFT_225122 [Capitella teleta]|uniref:Uncharacterized protein n=1 Tax=Capitella teleta TaxID=283909 RepID=R7TS96_CAPTE|nr:hypothetical protein CAPTEDRAFT_225122 [Capitella teleta]|eukprot:ELT96778.1 hypothetical protein CAPTEDRAFT_225122 [Capitella teleta]